MVDVASREGGDEPLTTQSDAQMEAADAAARARQVIAEKITSLATEAESKKVAKVILQIAEAYGHLASEPPRTRGG